MTKVDEYWANMTVINERLAQVQTPEQDKAYLKWRCDQYPQFRELMKLWGGHNSEVVLDYGCGAGNDVVGFGLYSDAKDIIGIDISEKALSFARYRVGLHGLRNVTLLKTIDGDSRIDLPDKSVDYVHCEGVLQHTSNPLTILKEFRRVLSGTGRVMVYIHPSLWLHLYIAYVLQVLEGKHQGVTAWEAFGRTTDGEDCPFARGYYVKDFVELCRVAGLGARFEGAYISRFEARLASKYLKQALKDERLGKVHKDYLKTVGGVDSWWTWPRANGTYAGKYGVFNIW